MKTSVKSPKTICEGVFLNEVTASKTANKTQFLQRNFSETKFSVSYLFF